MLAGPTTTMAALRLPHYAADLRRPVSVPETSPLLLFLHGKGERGSNLSFVRKHGPARLFLQFGLDRFFVLSPQCPEDALWDAVLLDEFVREAIDVLPVDRERVYLTGLSMGGFGGWGLAARSPELFAAVALICGGGEPASAPKLDATPIWLFHSIADALVPVRHSDELFKALTQTSVAVTYTRYRELDHVQTWEQAYGSTLLYDWFLQHRR